MRGEGGSRGVSANEYTCVHGAQRNFGYLTPNLQNLRLRPTALAQIRESTVLSPNFLTSKVPKHRFQRVEKLVLEEIDSCEGIFKI
jgi:hypothetical protein